MTIVFLLLAIGFEVGWATAMKVSQGFSRPIPSIVTVAAYILSLVFLALATRRLQLGVAYALWAGTGAALIAAIGVLWFKEPLTAGKAISTALIIVGIVGLQLSGGR